MTFRIPPQGTQVHTFTGVPFDPGQLHERFTGIVVDLHHPLNQPYRLEIDLTSAPPAAVVQDLASRFFNIDPRLVEVACSFSGRRILGIWAGRQKTIVIPRPEDPARLAKKRLWSVDETKPSPTMADEMPPLFKLEPGERNLLLRDRVYAGILGAILGDALGVPVEFKSREKRKIDPVISMRGHGTYNQPAGTWSDDSSLMLGLLTSLTVVGFDPAHQGLAYLRWRYGADLTAGGTVFDVGDTTGEVLRKILNGVPAEEAGGRDESHNGNGSLMRTLPLTFHLAMGGGDFLSEASLRALFHQSLSASAVTHAHPRSQLACAIYNILGRFLLAGFPLNSSLVQTERVMRTFVQDQPHLVGELYHFRRIFDPEFASTPEEKIQSSGYVVHTLEASIWSLLNSTSYREAVLKAVNLGDDTDTTGVVTGGLAGIMYGRNSLPEEWLDLLARRGDISEMADQFLKAEQARTDEMLEVLSRPIFWPRDSSSGPQSRREVIAQVQAWVEKNFDLIEIQLTGPTYQVREEAARRLGLLACERALALLDRPEIGLHDPTWMVRVAAGLGLAVNGSERALELLEKTVLKDSFVKVVHLTIANLGYSDSPLVHHLLIDRFLFDENPLFRNLAVGSLIIAATPETLAAVNRPGVGLRDPLVGIQKNAAFGLALLGTKAAMDLLDQEGMGLTSPDVEVQKMTAYGLGQSASPEGIRLLTRGNKGLRSLRWEIRAGAANGLGRSASPSGFQILMSENVFRDSSREVRESAADGLYHSPHRERIEKELAKDSSLLRFVRGVWRSTYET